MLGRSYEVGISAVHTLQLVQRLSVYPSCSSISSKDLVRLDTLVFYVIPWVILSDIITDVLGIDDVVYCLTGALYESGSLEGELACGGHVYSSQ